MRKRESYVELNVKLTQPACEG